MNGAWITRGKQEEYLDLIDLREIIDRLPKMQEFEALEAVLKPSRSEERTRWLVDLNEMRKVVAHPARSGVTADQRRRLEVIESLVARWADRLKDDSAVDR